MGVKVGVGWVGMMLGVLVEVTYTVSVGNTVGGGEMGIPGINLVISETEQANMDNPSIMIKAGFRIHHLVKPYFTSSRQSNILSLPKSRNNLVSICGSADSLLFRK